MKRSTPDRGLSLIEVLVALSIAAMALAIGFQALFQWEQAQRSFGSAERSRRELELTEAWIRDAMAGAIVRPSLVSANGQNREQDDAFRGDERNLSFTTLSPLLGTRGIATVQRWRLHESAGRWQLSSPGIEVPLTLPEGNTPRFVYLDDKGKLSSRWPRRDTPENRPLPAVFGIAIGQAIWLEAPKLSPAPSPSELVNE